MFQSRFVSSLEKCFPSSTPTEFSELSRISALRGECLSFQYVYRETDISILHRQWFSPTLEGDLAQFASIRIVELTPSLMPVYPSPRQSDTNYLKKEPGFYPDRLEKLPRCGIPACTFETRALWITVEIPTDAAAGEHILTLTVHSAGGLVESKSVTINVIAATLPEQKIKVTQWFHCDCIADYYRVPVFSEEHWRLVENFARTASENGITVFICTKGKAGLEAILIDIPIIIQGTDLVLRTILASYIISITIGTTFVGQINVHNFTGHIALSYTLLVS